MITGRPRLVVVGNGMAGMRTVEELLKRSPDRFAISVFGAEPQVNYNRILLSPLLAGETRFADIVINDRAWYDAHAIELIAGEPVVAIDRAERRVVGAQGTTRSYDFLLTATGSTPFVLPVPGATLPGTVTFRDVADVETMLAAAKRYRRAVVIGGGLLGLEAANGLMANGMEVAVIHLMPSLMERQLDAAAGALLASDLERRGMRILTAANTTAILGTDRVEGVRLDDGRVLAADLVVMAAGIRPHTALARASGLDCRRGVLVDDALRTSDRRIFAVGECVEHRGVTHGLVAPLWEMAAVCADQLSGIATSHYEGSVPATTLKVTGIDLFSAGDIAGEAGSESIVFRDVARGVYKRLIVRNDRLRGVVLYGDARDGHWYARLLREGTDIGPLRDALIFGPAYADAAALAAAPGGAIRQAA